MSKKLKIQMNGRSDEFGTPKEAIFPLLPYLKKKWIIWECAYGKGSLAKHLRNKGFTVIGNGEDFLTATPKGDCLITNPPYSIKGKFLEKAFEIGKPFAFLLPLTTLEGKQRGKLFKNNRIQLIIPNKRINFETPNGKGKGSWFATAWFCGNMNLPKDLNFVELEKKVEKKIK